MSLSDLFPEIQKWYEKEILRSDRCIICIYTHFQFRRKLTVLIDMYQHREPRDIFSDSSSSVSGADTIK